MIDDFMIVSNIRTFSNVLKDYVISNEKFLGYRSSHPGKAPLLSSKNSPSSDPLWLSTLMKIPQQSF
jgi:hypothetical protein